jgi:8-oxo-dGTP pyrophosphatase MutT (NUDIX family)
VTDPKTGWTTLSSRTVYENPWMRVTEDHVVTPKGAKSVYGVTRFPAPGCAILPLDDEGHTWIVGQFRYPIGRYTWELPAGSVGNDADPLHGAKRELAEETGLVAKHWHPLSHLAPVNAATNLESFGFLAWDLAAGDQNPDPGEELTLCRLPFSDALEMVLTGAISSAISVAMVLKAHTLALRGEMPPEVSDVLKAAR